MVQLTARRQEPSLIRPAASEPIDLGNLLTETLYAPAECKESRRHRHLPVRAFASKCPSSVWVALGLLPHCDTITPSR